MFFSEGRLPEASFSYDGYDELACPAVVAKLAEIDALPGAQIQPAAGNGNGDADAAEGRLGVGRHVVSALQRVLIFWTILGHQTVEDRFHVHTHVRIAILVDAQSATGVLREDIHEARCRQLGQLAQYLARHQMKAIRLRPQRDFYLLYHSFSYFYILLMPDTYKHLFLSDIQHQYS